MNAIRHDLVRTLGAIPAHPAIGSALARHENVLSQIDAAHCALLSDEAAGPMPVLHRRLLATFVAGLLDDPRSLDHYVSLLRASAGADAGMVRLILAEADEAARPSAYGRLSGLARYIDLDGPEYRASPAVTKTFGRGLAAALEHAHLLVTQPQKADARQAGKLAVAGFSAAEATFLAQLVGFLVFQIRLVAALGSYAGFRQHSLQVAQ